MILRCRGMARAHRDPGAEAASTVARRVVWFHSTGPEVSPKAECTLNNETQNHLAEQLRLLTEQLILNFQILTVCYPIARIFFLFF